MNQRLKDWLVALGIILIWTGLLSYMQTKDESAAEADAHTAGIIEGIHIESDAQKERQVESAFEWWVGSSDKEVVRARLCANYNRGKK